MKLGCGECYYIFIFQISKVWFLRSEICDMWVSFDVLCCTASILHLVAISIDRYWAVTNIDYIRNRTAKRILIMIAIVWFVAMSISIPPLFGWKDSNDPAVTGMCIISQNHGYTVFSTVGAFYLPAVLMLIIYAKIFSVARRRIRRKKSHKSKQKEEKAARKQTEMTMLTVPRDSPVSRSEVSECPYNGSSGSGDHDDNKNTFKTNGHVDEEEPSTAMLPTQTQTANGEILRAKKQKEKLEMKRERKAARTLAIITGSFIICWLPFFIMAIVVPFIRNEVAIPPIAESITLWLGYCNSLLNPIIYTIFNPEFRAAFQKILFGKYSKKTPAERKMRIFT